MIPYIMLRDKIQARIDEYQKELDKWNEQWRQIQDGEIPMMPPYADMVNRHIAMYSYQIRELKWVLKTMEEESNPVEEKAKEPV
jgi:hypothetical protein